MCFESFRGRKSGNLEREKVEGVLRSVYRHEHRGSFERKQSKLTIKRFVRLREENNKILL